MNFVDLSLLEDDTSSKLKQDESRANFLNTMNFAWTNLQECRA
jgi:hypothetical protein